MNKKFAIPAAALALAGATGCAEPIVSDWELTKLVLNGDVQELQPPEPSYDYGPPIAVGIAGLLEIDNEMDAALDWTKTVTRSSYSNENITQVHSYAYRGQATPGVGNFRGTYRIEMGESMVFECEVKEAPTKLVCDEFSSGRLLVFEPG
ncbi:MAG: hypothetical protein ACI9VR_002155 [Cognaticolwellia sp.]|jgi:hypothetical protein